MKTVAEVIILIITVFLPLILSIINGITQAFRKDMIEKYKARIIHLEKVLVKAFEMKDEELRRTILEAQGQRIKGLYEDYQRSNKHEEWRAAAIRKEIALGESLLTSNPELLKFQFGSHILERQLHAGHQMNRYIQG